jgi:Raf kinase inhibitor-like YbhB/YbcL family protein
MGKKIFVSIILLLLAALFGRLVYNQIQQKTEFDFHANITLTSENFSQNGDMPMEFTGYGKEASPELHWRNVPEGAKSFVVLCTDYDGPAPVLKLLTIDHWVVYNIPADKTFLTRASTSNSLKSEHIESGKNYKGTLEYKGPKPPLGKHRYFFRVYALSIPSLKLTEPTKKEVMDVMQNNVLAYGELIGRY